MLTQPCLQTSTNPTDWREDSLAEMCRWRITDKTPHAEIRRLYPLSAKVKANSRIYPGLKEGDVVTYVRTKLTPAGFPVEGITFSPGGARSICCFTPDEVDLFMPQE